jgi:sortase (surface protein transpeptidase)
VSTEAPSAQPPSTEPPSAPPQKRTGGDVARTVLRGVGQTLITLGVVVLLFVVYEVYVTDLFGAQKQAQATSAIDEVWANAESEQTDTVVVQNPDQLVTDPRQRTPNYEASLGQGFAKMYVPAFGADYVFTIIEGTDPDDLYIGPGHYTDTQLPGQQGNFAVAGHRVSKGAPFNDLGLLASCDAIVVETQDDWFVYRVLPMAEETATWADTQRAHCDGVGVQTGSYDGVYGREITVPSDYAQVLPVPHVNSTAVPADAERLITLTTCHPQFSDAERMIIHGVLVKSYAKSPGFLPPELGEG